MADTLVERVTGQTTASDVAVTVNVVMNNSTLFGGDDAPAQLDALGPIPALGRRYSRCPSCTCVRPAAESKSQPRGAARTECVQ